MGRLSFIFRTDVHVADRNPDSWKADYPAEVWSSLEQIGDLARKYKTDAVLDGGDFFHVKASTRNSHGLVARAASIHSAYPCPVYLNIGNHDVAYNNLDTLERQPLQVLFAAGVFQRMSDNTFESGGTRVRVVGFPYNPARAVDDFKSVERGDEDVLIFVIHALATEKVSSPEDSKDFFGEAVFEYKDFVYEGGPDVACFGHWHKDQGVVRIDDRYFVNPGAVSRGSLNNENLKRVPQVALIEIEDGKVSVGTIPLRVSPAKDVFDLVRKQRREQEGAIITQFVERLQKEMGASSDGDVTKTIEGLGFAPEVRNRALGYLEKARK
jgi:DNA repair exonuclease SbcCD nuclease subunit